MRISWEIEADDIQKTKQFVDSQRAKQFVMKRIARNIKGPSPSIDKEIFWKAVISCLMTTQQRSGPESSVNRFMSATPFPLSLHTCYANKKKLDKFVEKVITDFRGLRRAKSIAEEVDYNFNWLGQNGWAEVQEEIDRLQKCRKRRPQPTDRDIEKNAALYISRNMKGFGPKQSRNLWQSLGLTRYEIPIDSRITRWLNRAGFPLKLSANALSDANYYDFVMDGIQMLCMNSNTYPCILDAAAFASFDKDWNEKALVRRLPNIHSGTHLL
ncbi:MAG: hypothetical protein ACLPX5_12065 [Dissulfurispiraceae bacterium]